MTHDKRPNWLDVLFRDLAGFIEIRCLYATEPKPPRVEFCESIESARTFLAELRKTIGLNIYVGMATRNEYGKGSKDHLQACRALWIDYDFDTKGGSHQQFHVTQRTFPLPPTFLIDSGGGRHAYWILEDPVDLSFAEGIAWLEHALKGLQVHWRSDPSPVDATRIMRVPGTWNWPDRKKLARGRMKAKCSILDYTGHYYHRDDFDAFVMRGKAERKRSIGEEQKVESGALPMRISTALERSESARRLFDYDDSALPRSATDRSPSTFDFHLMRCLLRRHRTLRKSDLIQAAKVARARALTRGIAAQEKDEQYYERTYKKVLSSLTREAIPEPDRKQEPGRWLCWVLYQDANVERIERGGELRLDRTNQAPRYRTGIAPVDDALGGGLYGLSVVSGLAKSGKSLLGMQTGLLAAQTGWQVAYFNAEMSRSIVDRRIQRMSALTKGEIEQAILPTFHRFFVNTDTTFEEIREHIESLIESDTDRLLCIFDSINTLCDKMSGNTHYFEQMRRLILWMQDRAVSSEGRLAFLAMSELNQAKDVKGGKLGYSADVELRLEKKKMTGQINLAVERTRDTQDVNDIMLEIHPGKLSLVAESVQDFS